MFRQDRTNPSTAVSNWKGRRDTKRGHTQTAVSNWLNGGLFGPGEYVLGSTGGYWGGGTGMVGSLDRLRFEVDVIDTITVGAMSTYLYAVGLSDDGTACYLAMDYFSSPTADNIFKMTYANDVSAVITETITTKRYSTTGLGDEDRGLWIGGYNGDLTPGRRNETGVFVYATESESEGTDIGTAKTSSIGVSGDSFGYVVGGYTDSGESATCDKMTYTGGRSAGQSVPTAASGGTGCSNRDTAGYVFTPNIGGSPYDDVWKLTYATETFSTLSDVTPGGYNGHASGRGTGVNDGGDFGWLGGLNRSNIPNPSKIAFASDTFSVVSWSHSNGSMYNCAAFANGWTA